MWEWESEFESKKRTGLQVSENPNGISIFLTEEKSVKDEYNDGKNLINDEEIMTSRITDLLEMQNDSNALSKSYPRKGKRKHSAEKLHKCGQCSYSTASKTNLTTHLITHEEEKPYKCQGVRLQCFTEGSFDPAQDETLRGETVQVRPVRL